VTEPKTDTLEVPDAVLTYDIRAGSGNGPILMLIGSPMGAAGFETLAGHFGDRTVTTYDPRGVERSRKADPESESTPEQHADDLHRIITTLGGGPVDLFASSGGAVNALALVARHPEDVRLLVAHEPMIADVLPDREQVLAVSRDIYDTYHKSGFGPAMAKFLALAGQKGEIPEDYLEQPAPDPALFGLPTDDDGSRDDPLLGQNMISSTHFQPDFEALRSASTRIVVAVGEESEGELPHRGGVGVARRLGTEVMLLPGGHGGFFGGEYGQMGEPDAFALRLRELLAAPGRP
jgi:pimeloyl-ACP methyl ester carboxylesterase